MIQDEISSLEQRLKVLKAQQQAPCLPAGAWLERVEPLHGVLAFDAVVFPDGTMVTTKGGMCRVESSSGSCSLSPDEAQACVWLTARAQEGDLRPQACEGPSECTPVYVLTYTEDERKTVCGVYSSPEAAKQAALDEYGDELAGWRGGTEDYWSFGGDWREMAILRFEMT